MAICNDLEEGEKYENCIKELNEKFELKKSNPYDRNDDGEIKECRNVAFDLLSTLKPSEKLIGI